MNNMKTTDFLDEFIDALRKQLEDDEKRWGDTWLYRTRMGQELRTREKYNDYFDQFFMTNVPVPWLKLWEMLLFVGLENNILNLERLK